MHQRDSGAGSVPSTLQQHGPAATHAAARAVRCADHYDEGSVRLTANAVRPISNAYQHQLELCAHPSSLPAGVSDNACSL